MLRKKYSAVVLVCLISLLSGCASTELTAPCPEFGAHCDKAPINSWNSNY